MKLTGKRATWALSCKVDEIKFSSTYITAFMPWCSHIHSSWWVWSFWDHTYNPYSSSKHEVLNYCRWLLLLLCMGNVFLCLIIVSNCFACCFQVILKVTAGFSLMFLIIILWLWCDTVYYTPVQEGLVKCFHNLSTCIIIEQKVPIRIFNYGSVGFFVWVLFKNADENCRELLHYCYL